MTTSDAKSKENYSVQVVAAARVLSELLSGPSGFKKVSNKVAQAFYTKGDGTVPDKSVLVKYFDKLVDAKALDRVKAIRTLTKAYTSTKCTDEASVARHNFIKVAIHALGAAVPVVACEYKPDEPDKPDKPNKPDKPDQPDKPNKPDKPEPKPEPKHEKHSFPWWGYLIIGMVTLVVVLAIVVGASKHQRISTLASE